MIMNDFLVVFIFQKADDVYEFPEMRVDKLLSTFGLSTRSRSKQFAKDFGISTVEDPEKFLVPNSRVLPSTVLIGGEPLPYPRPLHIMLYKPEGYVCSHKEDPSIYSLLPGDFDLRSPKLVSAGRLDQMASGILILSQNGRIIQRLISPKHHLEKQYLVEVSSDLDLDTKKEQTAFADGNIAIRNRKTNELERCSPARLEYIGPRTARVWLAEGRYHQLRRMFAALDNEVVLENDDGGITGH
eukprot:jgi/Bigna1/146420/aug1.114_g21128